MSDIFISYASEDRERVKSMAHALERKGWSVWWDRRIPTGRSFDEVIEEALDAAKAVVVVWTKASVNSTWVKNEARKGMRRGVLFPVLLLEEVKIPLEFEHLQAAHLMDWRSGKLTPASINFSKIWMDSSGHHRAPWFNHLLSYHLKSLRNLSRNRSGKGSWKSSGNNSPQSPR